MEQLEFDLRLDYERDLKDNLGNVTKFAANQISEHARNAGQPLKVVESKQEAYGIAAQQYVGVCGKQKELKGGMDDFLKLLNANGDTTQAAAAIYNAALELAQASVIMAAQASRILSDLYYKESKTPIEEFYETNDEESDEEMVAELDEEEE